MKITEHARNRGQQRGLRPALINLIVDNGSRSNRPGNASELRISKRDATKLIEELKHEINLIQKACGRSVILDDDGSTVITIF